MVRKNGPDFCSKKLVPAEELARLPARVEQSGSTIANSATALPRMNNKLAGACMNRFSGYLTLIRFRRQADGRDSTQVPGRTRHFKFSRGAYLRRRSDRA